MLGRVFVETETGKDADAMDRRPNLRCSQWGAARAVRRGRRIAHMASRRASFETVRPTFDGRAGLGFPLFKTIDPPRWRIPVPHSGPLHVSGWLRAPPSRNPRNPRKKFWSGRALTHAPPLAR
jgi:hypothetical protein